MPITRRITARYYKRARTKSLAGASGASPSSVPREEPEVRNLPISETLSGLVTTSAQTSPPTHAPAQKAIPEAPTSKAIVHAPAAKAISLSAHLRDARARAEEILRQHPRHDGRTGATCQPCLVDFPCDAVRAAQDVIAITAKLHVGRPLSNKALLELLSELVDLGATGAARANPKADPPAPRAKYSPGTAAVTPN